MDILCRTDDLVVLNKPPGVSLLSDRSGVECLWDRLPELLGQKPYLVHRLDKPTSGVLLIALNQSTQRKLTRLFQQRRVRKFYLGWVAGQPPARGHIDLPLKKGRKSRFRIAGQRADIAEQDGVWSLPRHETEPDPLGHDSQTRFRVLLRHDDRSLLLLQPLTGRTHQLRVHLSWIGYPLIGDAL
ncbi:MAG: RluA family pseudouridine synthase, partial [Pseudomonadales bacterium]